MGVRKLAAWMGLVEDGRYREDEIDDTDGELTDDVFVEEEEPSAEISRVQALPQRRPNGRRGPTFRLQDPCSG